jgi:tetratricopeptide (TPR) repeat protein
MINAASNQGTQPMTASDNNVNLEDDDPPVIIVKKVARTKAPPAPKDSSSEDILPDMSNTHDDDGMPPLEVDLQLQRAMEFIEQENFTSALSYLNRAIIDVPPERLAECFSLRGYVHLKNLDFSRSEADCAQAINQGWEDAQTYAWRAAARGEQNKWRAAFDDLEKAAELAGPHRDQYIQLMDSYSQTASEHFRELIKNGNETADLFFERGWIYLRSAKYQKAERDFNHAIAIQPKHPWASVGLAMLRVQHGNDEGIIDLCSVGAHGDPDCERQALQIRAHAKRKAGRIASAQRDLDRLIELAGDDSQQMVECCRLSSELGNHVKAIERISTVLETDKEHYLARLIRGDCYRAIKNYSLAIADYKQYLRFYPTDTTALIRRAEMYLLTDRLEQAHADLDEAMQSEKTNFEAYLIRSKLFLKEDKLDQALTDCQKAVRLENQEPEAFAVLAQIYQKLCDYSRATEEYSRSVELAANDHQQAHYLYHRGTMYYEMEDFEKARKDFKKSCKLRPSHPGSWIWKAAACARLEKWSNAIIGLQNAISVRPSASEQYQILGKPVAEKAIVYFDRQEQRGHDSAETFRKRGLAYQFLAKNVEAIKDFTAALEKQSDDAETLIRRGQAYADLGKHDSAVEDFTRVIRVDGNNHEARYHRSISRASQGKIDEARSDLIKSIKTSPLPRYNIQLSEVMQKVGDTPKALEYLDKAVLLDPTDPNSFRKRGVAHLQAHNYLNAVSDFTHSLELYPTQIDVIVLRGQAHLKAEELTLAIEDFELALTHNDKLSKAYSGRASALVSQGKMEYALIWLTKAIHRFENPRQLSEILFARGKAFYQMGRYAPATADFSQVIELMRSDPKTVVAARYARALTNAKAKRFDKAARDFRRLKKLTPNDAKIQAALDWFEDTESKTCPEFLNAKIATVRPTRPGISRSKVELVESISKWEVDPPHDTWVVRNEEKREYGPVHYSILKTWINEGRVDIGMKVLRADWSKWKRAEKIFPELSPVGSHRGNMVDDFPGIDVEALENINQIE